MPKIRAGQKTVNYGRKNYVLVSEKNIGFGIRFGTTLYMRGHSDTLSQMILKTETPMTNVDWLRVSERNKWPH